MGRRRTRRFADSSSDDDFQIDHTDSSSDDDHQPDPSVSQESDPDLQPQPPMPRRKPRHKAGRKKKIRAPARRISRPSRPRRRRDDTSDEDFEIDDAESSLDAQDLDNEEDGAVTRSAKRARYSDSGAPQVRGSEKRNTGKDNGESASQSAGAEEESLLQTTQSRSTSGVSGRSIHSDVGADKGFEKRNKGKQIVVEGDTETKIEKIEDEPAVVCGVCLSEEVAERGKLDCCDHFFCFTCIMEWAKVESRCPMCKQRFVTIVRPSIMGSKRTRTVRVPLRDQVYEPPEEAEEEEDDPYSEIVCMECLEAGEEGLLLLCDQCDSAAHTYCVGLGRSVPRGDWFCRTCQTTMPESSGSEDEEEVLGYSDDEDQVSILRVIVATLETGRHRTAMQTTVQRPSSSVTRGSPSARRRRRLRGSRRRLLGRLSGRLSAATRRMSQDARTMTRNTESAGHQHPHMSNTQAGPARTVPQQRRLQERIQTMRDNWGRIQRGDLAIGSCSTIADQTLANSGGGSIVSRVEPRSSTQIVSTEEKQNGSLLNLSSTSAGPPSGRGCSRHVDSEIEQAWRMMECAKNLSVGASCASVQQKLGASQEGTGIPANTGIRPAAGSSMNANTGSTCRASSNNFNSRNSLDVRMKPAGLLSSRDSIHMDGSVSNCLEIASKADGVRENSLEEAGGKELSNQSNIRDFSCGSGSVGPTLIANSGMHSKQQVPLCAGSRTAIRAKESELASVRKCSSEAPGTSSEHILNCQKETVTKKDSEAGKMHPLGKEYGSIKNSDHSDYFLPFHTYDTYDKGVRDLPDEKHDLAGGGKRDARNLLDKYHNETGHLINAAASSYASLGQKSRSECIKGGIAAMVKTELWPLYLSEGFDKEHFKKVARCAVHMLLDAHCSENGKSNPNQLYCGHTELQEKSTLAGCCDNCLKLEVRKVIRTVKAKIETG